MYRLKLAVFVAFVLSVVSLPLTMTTSAKFDEDSVVKEISTYKTWTRLTDKPIVSMQHPIKVSSQKFSLPPSSFG